MTTFYLLRHGLTYWNVEHKMQGQVNIPLNDEGRDQARVARTKLADVPFDVCYASPLSRALETAQIVLEGRDVPIVENNLLVEQAYGLAEGYCVATGLNDTEYPAWGYDTHPELYRGAIGAETFDVFFARMQRVIDEIMVPASREYENVLIAAHGAVCCGIVDLILGYPIERFWDTKIENCGTATIQIDENGIRVTDAPSINGRPRIAGW